MALPARTRAPVAQAPIACPKCRASIPVSDVNIEQGVALCRACTSIVRLTDIADRAALGDDDTRDVPNGCTLIDIGDQQVVAASTRSVGGFFACLFIYLFWNGIVSVFVLANVASTVKVLGGQLPTWFPAPTGISSSLGMTLFLWVFLTPFLAVGLAIFVGLLLCIAGRVEVRMRSDRGEVFTGIGSLGWRRSFDLARVTRVALVQARSGNSDATPRAEILIAAETDIRFGSGIPESRRRWMAAVLHRLLLQG